MPFIRTAYLCAVLPAAVVAVAVVASLAVPAHLIRAAEAHEPGADIALSGTVRSETREPGAFGRVALGGPFDVEIRQGSREAVTLRGDDQLLALVETTIEGSGPGATLHVRYRHGTRLPSTPRIAVVVEMIHVDAIALGGVGDIVARRIRTGNLSVSLGGVGRIDLPDLDTDALSLSMGGSGRVHVDGRAATLKLSVAGSGICQTEGLAADDVSVAIAGSGNAHVRADRSLTITIAGSGHVVYRGDATPSMTVLGSGNVRKG